LISRVPRQILIERQSENGWDRGCTIRLTLIVALYVATLALAVFSNPTSQLAVLCYVVGAVVSTAYVTSRVMRRAKPHDAPAVERKKDGWSVKYPDC
jgi:hypothetical protein